MIDPDFWHSEDISKLSIFERLLFIGMFSNADDAGKGRANPRYLCSIIFPYDDIRTAEVDKALLSIGRNTSVTLYECGGSRYYRFEHWKKWQKVEKPQPSKLPDPPQAWTQARGEAQAPGDGAPEGARQAAEREEGAPEGERQAAKPKALSPPRCVVDASETPTRRDADARPTEQKGRQTRGKAEATPQAAALQLTLQGGDDYPIAPEQLRLWQGTYAGVDVLQELQKMQAWLLANPARRKTRQGIQRFITGWLCKQQEKGGAHGDTDDAAGRYGVQL